MYEKTYWLLKYNLVIFVIADKYSWGSKSDFELYTHNQSFYIGKCNGIPKIKTKWTEQLHVFEYS